MSDAGALYRARVMHRRRVAPRYRFTYDVYYLLLDLDRIGALAHELKFFSLARWNLFSLDPRDYGDGSGQLRAWAERALASAGIALAGGRIRLLTMPRVLGLGFNPISLWYCEHADGSLRAVIAEVRNTFGEKHCYLLDAGGGALAWGQMPEKDKCFHVSPFFDLVGRYRFVLEAPGETLGVRIHESREHVSIMDATLHGSRHELSDRSIALQVLRLPWLMFKVVGGIHWEALKLWLRGARFHAKPEPPAQGIT